MDNDMYESYGRETTIDVPTQSFSSDSRPKPPPGRLNLSQFDNITDAVGRLNFSHQAGVGRKGLSSSSSHQQRDESLLFKVCVSLFLLLTKMF